LLAGSLASGRLASGLLGSGHLERGLSSDATARTFCDSSERSNTMRPLSFAAKRRDAFLGTQKYVCRACIATT
jgi:hypothetical protein